MAVKLGDLLVKAKLVTPEQVEAALQSQRDEGGKFGEALIRIGAVSEQDITETLSQQFGVPSIDLAHPCDPMRRPLRTLLSRACGRP